jgi:DNA-binding MarR family transcriptional regulator
MTPASMLDARDKTVSRTRRGPRRRSSGANPRSLARLEIRVTYRTCRVLAAIESDPGLSNKQAAAAAGITDQGQISRLLARLSGLELIENGGSGQIAGHANAWQLTPAGRELQRELSRSHVLSQQR